MRQQSTPLTGTATCKIYRSLFQRTIQSVWNERKHTDDKYSTFPLCFYCSFCCRL